jgi:hypothetical protein
MKVIFHKLFPYAPYLNEYIGAEMDFPDTKEQYVFDGYVDKLREMAENNHKKKYPQIYTELVPSTDFNTGQPAVVQVEKQEQNTIAILIKDIESETKLGGPGEAGGLMSWKLMVEKHPELQPVFDKKKKELVAKESKEIIDAADNLLNKKERQELLRKADGHKSKN